MYFGDGAPNEPAIYRHPPKSEGSYDFLHLAAVPFEPDDFLEYGIRPPTEDSFPPLWRAPQVV